MNHNKYPEACFTLGASRVTSLHVQEGDGQDHVTGRGPGSLLVDAISTLF